MAQAPQPRSANGLSLDAESAAALDAAIDAVQNGRPFDRAGCLARHPQLADALAALNDLVATRSTTVDNLPAAEPLAPLPVSIGPYRVEREIGAGGFGVVYLAFDPDVKRRVALKVLHPGRLDQPEAVRRFQREACAIARLQHPGIVQLYDYSRQGPPYFLVTEYVEGTDPREWCRRQNLGVNGVAELVARIAEAAEHAHAQGVCHRDLKPGNILIDADGEPHILDFGLARLDRFADPTTAPTSDGHILGSLPYMAPEQAAGHSHAADARSDVYSLGVVLYELLAGRLPFQGLPHELPARVVEEAPPPPRRFNPAIPRKLEAVCLKALAKQPCRRYASAAGLAQDLRAFLTGGPLEAQQPSLLSSVSNFLGRRHRDTLLQGWTLLMLLLGVTIFAGCAAMNYWEMHLPPERRLLPMILTKVVQVAVMLFFAWWFRPVKETRMTAAERQIWTLVPAYYGGFLALLVVNRFLEKPIPLAPMLAVLSGMGFATLGATIWGWFYVYGAAFFALAVAIVFCEPYGLTVVGAGWLVCFVLGSVHLRWTR